MLAGVAEPLARELVAERAVLGGEHLVGGVAHERVTELVLVTRRETRDVAALHDLAARELGEPVVDLARLVVAAGEREETAAPEHLAEDARRAEHATRLGSSASRRASTIASTVPGSDHASISGSPPVSPPEGGGERRAGACRCEAGALGERADQLLEIEDVAGGAIEQARALGGVDVVAEHLAHEPLAGAAYERPEADLLEAPLLPQIRERLVDLAARDREHHERPLARRAQRGVDEVHAREVAPVQVLEDEDERARLPASASTSSQNARRIWSPISIASWRAARSCTLFASGKWTLAISPRNSVTRATSASGT